MRLVLRQFWFDGLIPLRNGYLLGAPEQDKQANSSECNNADDHFIYRLKTYQTNIAGVLEDYQSILYAVYFRDIKFPTHLIMHWKFKYHLF